MTTMSSIQIFDFGDFVINIKTFVVVVASQFKLFFERGVYGQIALFGGYCLLYVAFNRRVGLQNFGKHGDYSYGLYLYAFPIQQLLIYHFKTQITALNLFPLAFVLSLMCAFFSWHLVEKRFLQLKKSVVEKVAVGAPTSVLAGKYAHQVLEKIGIWKIVEKKAVRGKDVREVLTQVELGNVDAGIVYLTDARISKKVKIVSIAPEKLHAPIRYSVAVVSASNKKTAAKKFAAYLRSTPAQAKLRRYGFIGAK